jgi:DNA repair exonuclease SbcCD ATPase subunit
MKVVSAALLLLANGAAASDTASPVAKVIDMLSSLQAKILKEGEASQKAYDDYAEWCEDTAKNLQFEEKTGKQTVAELKATIVEEASRIEALTAKVEELAAAISTADADLKSATEIRKQESADFAKEEAELSDTIDTIGRAISIISRQMNGGAALVQVKNANDIVQALTVMVQAAAMNSNDAAKLTALVQSSQKSEDSDEDEETGAPAAATYESKSGSIVDVLSGLQEEATDKLDEARKKEVTATHNFEMLKGSLTDQAKFATQDKDDAQKGIAQAGEKKAVSEGDLEVSTKDLTSDMSSLGDLHRNCMEKAAEFESGTKSRGEELNALAAAKKTIKENVKGALLETDRAGLQMSFLQVSLQSQGNEAVRIVRDLARKDGSRSLAQLASRMSSMIRLSSGSSDPFAKIKGLISGMIEKLENEADSEATEKAYCDKELAESRAKSGELGTEIEKLTTAIDQATARSSQLKSEVAVLQKELADLAASQQSWTKFRAEEKAVYDNDRPELEQALDGIKTALKVLRDYYAANADASGGDGAAGGIISLLEVCESDFSKGLAETIATEESAVATFEAEMKDIEIEKTTKEKDVEYKTKEHVGLDKSVSESSKDRQGVQAELDAVSEYLTKLEGRCIAKAESYESIVKRREAEINGLKEALEVLGGAGAALLQTRRALRGVQHH